MQNIRMLPPVSGETSITFNGRTYSCAVGSYLDVPEVDARVLAANGWRSLGQNCRGVGATTARPTDYLRAGDTFIDTTLSAVVQWDGAAWRDVQTGATA